MSNGNQQLRRAFLFGQLLALGLGAIPASAADKTFYRYTDENGVTVFSQTAPSAGTESARVRGAPPPAVNPAAAQQQLDDEIQALEDLREDRALADQAAQRKKQADDQRQQACAAAQKNLTNYQAVGRQRVRETDGSYRRLTEPERLERLQSAKQAIKEHC